MSDEIIFNSAFAEVGIKLIENKNLPAIPIMYDDKMPATWTPRAGWQPLKNWQQYAERLPIRQEYEYWAGLTGCNVGLCLGRLANIIALDFDYFDELTDKIYAKLPPSPVRKRGVKGFTAFYKFNGEKNQKWSKDKQVVVELLSDGRQTVLPPSTHPSGCDYVWLTEVTLLNFTELPVLPSNYCEIIEDVINGVEQVEQRKNPVLAKVPVSKGYSETSEEDIVQALKKIPADEYHLWVKIGMALKNWDSVRGFQVWDAWSSTSSKYDGTEKLIKKWHGFRDSLSGGFNLSSVFWEAKQYGYLPKRVEQLKALDPVFYDRLCKVETKKEVNIKIAEDKFVKKINPLPIDIVLTAPNLVGIITDYIIKTSLYPQPELALAAALSFVGALKGHRVRSESDLRTNNYIVGIAPSSAGKDHAISCLQKIVQACSLKNLYGGKPVSDAGLLSMLQADSRRLIVWDEIGLAFKEISDPKAQGFRKSILTLMMELFSSANKTFFGKQYSNRDGNSPRVDIDRPCLGVYGVTTPSHFYQSLNYGMVADGFISRFLVFEIADSFPDKQRVNYEYRNLVPQNIIEQVAEIEAMKQPKNELDFGAGEPQAIAMTDEAKEYMEELGVYYLNKKREWYQIQDGMQSMYGRAEEHIIKIALTVQSGNRITLNDVFWAHKVVDHCIEQLVIAIQKNLTQTEFGRKLIVTREILEKAGKAGINRTELNRKLYYAVGTTKEVSEVLAALIDLGEVSVQDGKVVAV